MDRTCRFAGALGLTLWCAAALAAPPTQIVRARAVDADRAWFDAVAQPVLLTQTPIQRAVWRTQTRQIPFELRTDRIAQGLRVRLHLEPVPEGAGVLELHTADGIESLPATWLPRALRAAVKTRRQLRKTPQNQPERHAIWQRGHTILAALPDGPWVRAERGLLDATRHGFAPQLPALSRIAEGLATHPEIASWFRRVVAQNLGRIGLFSQARHWVERARLANPHPGSAHIQAALEARLSLWTGRFQRGLVRIDDALDQATRLGDVRRQASYRLLKTDLLAAQGRHLDAVSLAEALARDNPTPTFAVARDWHRLDAMRRCALPPRYDLLLHDLYATATDPTQPEGRRQVTSLNGLLAATRGKNAAIADALVPVVRRLNATGPWVALGQLLIAERARQAQDWTAATAGYQAVLADADRRFGGIATDETWQALHGLGRIARDRAAPGLAALFFDAALHALDEASRVATARVNRADWFADRRALIHDMLQVLLDLDLPAHAMAHLERYRAPATRALLEDSRLSQLNPTQAAEWQRRIDVYERAQLAHAEMVDQCEGAAPDDSYCLTHLGQSTRAVTHGFDGAYGWLDRVSPPVLGQPPPQLPEGTAALMVTRFEDGHTCEGGWTYSAFITADGVRWAPPDADPVAHWLPQFKALGHVWLIGDHPALLALPHTSIGLKGAVWGETTGLSFVPGLAWLSRADAPPTGQPVAIVDPDGTVQRPMPAVIAANPLQIRGSAATRAATLDAIDGARWLVFDGHGVVDGDAWSAHLALADGPLTLGDLLARRPQIGTAVLSGCESALGARWSRAERLGLADGVLLAGARSVLATDIKVPVDDAARFVEAFVQANGLAQPGVGYRAAIRTLRRQGDDAWRHWRLFGHP